MRFWTEIKFRTFFIYFCTMFITSFKSDPSALCTEDDVKDLPEGKAGSVCVCCERKPES